MTMTLTTPITVARLADIVESQRCLYGDAPLTVRPQPDTPFFLQAGEHYILDAQCDADMAEDNITLSTLSAALKGLAETLTIHCQDKLPAHMQIGLLCPDDGFVETLSTQELALARPARSNGKKHKAKKRS